MAGRAKAVNYNGNQFVSKSDAVIVMYNDGVRKCDIARRLGTHYSYVNTIVSKWCN